MSALFCPNCGKSVPKGAKFCESCGHGLQSKKDSTPSPQQQPPQYQQQPPQYQQQPPQYQQQQPQYQQGQYPPPNQEAGFMNRFQKPPDYVRPPNYIETTTVSQRIIGTMKMNVHVVEEIEARPDLQSEALKLLIVSLIIKTLVEIIAVLSLPEVYIVNDQIGTIVERILASFVGGFVYIYLIANIGQFIGGRETSTNTNEMLRMLSYAYVISAIADVVSVAEQIENAGVDLEEDSLSGLGIFLMFAGFILIIYSFIVFAFVIRRALDRGYGIAIITIILSFVILIIFQILVTDATEAIFGETWEFVPKPEPE